MTMLDSIDWSNLPKMEGDILKEGIIHRTYGSVDVTIYVNGSRTVWDTDTEDKGFIRNRYDVKTSIAMEPKANPFIKKWSNEERVCDSKLLESSVCQYIETMLKALEQVFS